MKSIRLFSVSISISVLTMKMHNSTTEERNPFKTDVKRTSDLKHNLTFNNQHKPLLMKINKLKHTILRMMIKEHSPKMFRTR